MKKPSAMASPGDIHALRVGRLEGIAGGAWDTKNTDKKVDETHNAKDEDNDNTYASNSGNSYARKATYLGGTALEIDYLETSARERMKRLDEKNTPPARPFDRS